MTEPTPPQDASGYLILPANRNDALAMLRIAGISLIGPAIRYLEDHDDPGNRHKWLAFHDQLNTVGYGIKELTGVDVGAGGGNKSGGGGGG